VQFWHFRALGAQSRISVEAVDTQLQGAGLLDKGQTVKLHYACNISMILVKAARERECDLIRRTPEPSQMHDWLQLLILMQRA
jgi:hypothetical protein